MLSVTKIVEFEAAHRLPRHKGKCENLHGHTYRAEVEVRRKEQPEKTDDYGMVIDFSSLKECIMIVVDNFFDHKYLNDTVDSLFPTAETLCVFMYTAIQFELDIRNFNVDIIRIRVWETSTSYAEYKEK